MAKSELVDLVDGSNQVVGQAERAQMRRDNLLHRGVAILVGNSQGQIYVHQRTASKDLFPAMFDMFVGGVVGAGEDYRAAAVREVGEELGVAAAELEHLFDHLYQGPHNRSWVRCYRCCWDGPIVHQPEEVQWGQWLPAEQVSEWISQVPVVPDGLELYEVYRKLGR